MVVNTTCIERADSMAPKKKEIPAERPILGRFKSNLKVGHAPCSPECMLDQQRMQSHPQRRGEHILKVG